MQHQVKYIFVFGQPDGGKADLIAKWKQSPQMPAFDVLGEHELLNKKRPQKHILVECARGDAPLGYKTFLESMTPTILQNSILVYIQTKYREVFERLFEKDDWRGLTGGHESGQLFIQGQKLPFLSIDSETAPEPFDAIAQRFEPALLKLLSSPSATMPSV
jgi:hypothetical protein